MSEKWLVWIHDWEDRKPIGIFDTEADARAVADQVTHAGYGPVRTYVEGDRSLTTERLWCVRAYAVGDNAAISIYQPEHDDNGLSDASGVVEAGHLVAGTVNWGHNNDGPYAIAYAATPEEAERLATERITALAAPIKRSWAMRREAAR